MQQNVSYSRKVSMKRKSARPRYGLSISQPWNGHNFELLITFLSPCPVNVNESSFVNFLFKLWTCRGNIRRWTRVYTFENVWRERLRQMLFEQMRAEVPARHIMFPHKEHSMLYLKTHCSNSQGVKKSGRYL